MNWIKRTLSPQGYHGNISRPPFFEGWYIKLVSRDERQRFAIIPGVFLGKNQQGDHSFVQVFDGGLESVRVFSSPLDAFEFQEGKFDISIGKSAFSAQGIDLNLHDAQHEVSGQILFSELTPWPASFFSPGIMGWFSWIPFMECFHGIVSLDHAISGSLRVDGRIINFDGGRGYIEKDWGRTFPSAWVWTQTNHFDQPGTSLTASIATIPWIGQAFRGFIIGLLHAGHLYRFATYTGARVEKLSVNDQQVEWIVRDRQFRLSLLLHRSSATVLAAPRVTDMNGRVGESLSARVDVLLEHVRGGIILQQTGRVAGLEVVGDIPRLLQMR